ncbi:hypothetical protein C8R43DRAFT_1163176 [Mycena crocata]|nr:hypothetical protein C8R43DRAFT_1163176 [Mycena crocata]
MGPNAAKSTLLDPNSNSLRSEGWKAAQSQFLAGRVSRRAARKSRNEQKKIQNAERETRRNAAGVTAGGAGDTFGEDEQPEEDSDDDHEVPEPQISGGNSPPVTAKASDDLSAIMAVMKDMNPATQQLFLQVMTNMTSQAKSATSPSVGTSVPAPEKPAAIPRIFNSAALAIAGVYLERSIFTNERILDMFVNQGDAHYQPKKRTIVSDGKVVQVYTMDPSIFEDETTLSHIRFDEAHANYRRWFVENAPVDAAPRLEAYDKHRQRCRDVDLVDEKDFIMIQRWCREYMQRQTWSPTEWNETRYSREFETSRARYFEAKFAKQVADFQAMQERSHGRASRDAGGDRGAENSKGRSTYPDRSSSSSYPERTSPYGREKTERDQRSFRKDASSTLCLKCGDAGHVARECRAQRTAKGGATKIFSEGGKIFWLSDPKVQVCVAWNLYGVCEARNAVSHSHACTLCGSTKHHTASGKC